MANEGVLSLNDDAIRDRHCNSAMALKRSKLEQRVNGKDVVPLTDWRTWDALATNLPGTPAADDLGLVTGTFGTDAPQIQTGDLKAAGSTTRRARALLQLPEDYEDGETVTLRVYAGMNTTIADTAATLDAEVHRVDPEAITVGADICATAAIDVNEVSIEARDFSITAATLVAGDVLDVRLSFLVNDAATGTAVTGTIVAVQLLTDRR